MTVARKEWGKKWKNQELLTLNPNQDCREDKNHKRFHFEVFLNSRALNPFLPAYFYRTHQLNRSLLKSHSIFTDALNLEDGVYPPALLLL